MLKVDDIRQTRVYRDAQEEARQEEQLRQQQRDRIAIAKMAAKEFSAEEIAEILSLSIEFVRDELAKSGA